MTQSTEAMRLTDDEAYVTHLLSCALTGAAPLPLPRCASWEGAFRLAAANSVTSTCAFAVSRVPGVTPGGAAAGRPRSMLTSCASRSLT